MESKTNLIRIGRLWDTAWDFYARKFKNLASIALLPVATLLLLVMFLQLSQIFITRTESIAIALALILLGIILIVSGLLFGPALISEIVRDNGGEGRSYDRVFKDAYCHAAQMLPSYLWLVILIIAVEVSAFCVFFVPGIWVEVMLCFAVIVLFAEKEKGIRAMAVSWNYVNGNWWPVFGRLIVLGIVALISFKVVSILSLLLSVGLIHNGYFSGIFVQIFLLFFLFPFVFSYLYSIYLSLKSGKPERVKDDQVKKITNGFAAIFIIGVLCAVALFGILGPTIASSFQTETSSYGSHPWGNNSWQMNSPYGGSSMNMNMNTKAGSY